MAVRQVKTEKRCKLCQSSHRSGIDALLELRSQGLDGADGKRVTEAVVIAACVEWGVLNPTKDNLTAHWRRHCERIDEEIAVKIDEAVEASLAKLDSGTSVDPDYALDRVITVAMAEMEERIAQGQRSGVTVDMALKAIEAKTRRGHAESQSELLRALGGGIEDVFKKALGGDKPKAELPVVVEDAVYTEVS